MARPCKTGLDFFSFDCVLDDKLLTFDEQLQQQVDWYNAREGKLVGYDCRKCKNKGYIAKLRG